MCKVRDEVNKQKHNNPKTKSIDFILESPRGSLDNACRIIRTLRKKYEEVNIIVVYLKSCILAGILSKRKHIARHNMSVEEVKEAYKDKRKAVFVSYNKRFICIGAELSGQT